MDALFLHSGMFIRIGSSVASKALQPVTRENGSKNESTHKHPRVARDKVHCSITNRRQYQWMEEDCQS